MIGRISKILNLGNTRNKILAKNIGLTSLFQIGSVALSLIILPISLSLLPVEEYGIWLTISSILMWVGYLDFGLGTGLKNKLGEAIAKSDFVTSRTLISTAFLTIMLIMCIAASVFFILTENFDITKIFGASNSSRICHEALLETVNIVAYIFFFRFVCQLINPILEAFQKMYWSRVIHFFSQLLILMLLIALKYTATPSILILGIIFSIAPVFCSIIGIVIFFWKSPEFRPSIFLIDFKCTKELYSVGLKFFLIQLNMLVLFQSSNLLIVNFIGPKEVVKYNIALNLFSMMNIAFSTISAPYWSAFTYAWVQKDIDWIKKAQRKLIYIWLFVVATSFVVLFFSDYLYSIWVGDKVLVPVSLSIAVFVYMVIFTFGMIYNVFINSTGKIYLQTIALSILTVLYIPLVLFFINILQWGVNSIPVALSIVSIYTVIISPVQSKRILKGSANGIWNK